MLFSIRLTSIQIRSKSIFFTKVTRFYRSLYLLYQKSRCCQHFFGILKQNNSKVSTKDQKQHVNRGITCDARRHTPHGKGRKQGINKATRGTDHAQKRYSGAGNQKGSVESLVKWVKGNFLPGRIFQDDDDLSSQAASWQEQSNRRPSAATGEPPMSRLPLEAAQGGKVPHTIADYGFLEMGHVSS
jgi:hypothetical protein